MFLRPLSISIHAPSRERRIVEDVKFVEIAFQSTLPHGSDSGIPHLIHSGRISIHAPSRERLLCFGWFPSDVRFQSTLPHGSDGTIRQSSTNKARFQSTLPHGSDRNIFVTVTYNRNFNPRSLTGATYCRRCKIC